MLGQTVAPEPKAALCPDSHGSYVHVRFCVCVCVYIYVCACVHAKLELFICTCVHGVALSSNAVTTDSQPLPGSHFCYKRLQK